MQLIDFAAKTEIIYREHKSVPDLWPIAIDYGYSAVKGFSPNKVFCFPNCALKKEFYSNLAEPSEKEIILKEKEDIWIVGEKAHDLLTPSSAMNYESDLYSRNRYLTPYFKALMKVSLGLAITGNHFRKYHGEPLVLQTGLPPEYMGTGDDIEMLKESLAGEYDFELKIGKAAYRHFHFTLTLKNIFVIPQPMGALFSTIMDNKAQQSPSDMRILNASTLVFDPGFKTVDIYEIISGMYHGSKTFEELGMHEIFRRTAESCKNKYNANITVASMQNALKKGYISAFDRRLLQRTKIDFSDLLIQNSSTVCEEAITKVLSLYNYLQNHDYLIITGGTGNVWYPYIADKLAQMDGLIILPANQKDLSLSTTYSNVRGYYYYLISMLSIRR